MSAALPSSMDREAVARWLDDLWASHTAKDGKAFSTMADAVRALLFDFGVKCRKAKPIYREVSKDSEPFIRVHVETDAEVVSRVMESK